MFFSGVKVLPINMRSDWLICLIVVHQHTLICKFMWNDSNLESNAPPRISTDENLRVHTHMHTPKPVATLDVPTIRPETTNSYSEKLITTSSILWMKNLRDVATRNKPFFYSAAAAAAAAAIFPCVRQMRMCWSVLWSFCVNAHDVLPSVW